MSETVKQEGEFKVKPRKMKKLSETPKTIKVDLSKKAEETYCTPQSSHFL